MKPEELEKLAALARIRVEGSELQKFTEEFDAIVRYVGQLEKLEVPAQLGKPVLRNVMREDGEPNEPGRYTERIAAQFPQREGDYLVVKQIITHE